MYEANHVYSNVKYSLLSYRAYISQVLKHTNKYITISFNKSKILFKNRYANSYIDKNIKKSSKEEIMGIFKVYKYIAGYSGIINVNKIPYDETHKEFDSSVFSILFKDDEEFDTFFDTYIYGEELIEEDMYNILNALHISNMTKDFFIKLINYTYKYSFFPTITDVTKLLERNINDIKSFDNFLSMIQYEFIITQAELFKLFPGIYYNILCRSACHDTNIVKLQRARRRETEPDSVRNGVPVYRPFAVENYNNVSQDRYNKDYKNYVDRILSSNDSKINKAKKDNNILCYVINNYPYDKFNGPLTLLLDKGFDANMVNDNGDTPLHCSIKSNKNSNAKYLIIIMLLRKNADPNIKDASGKSVLHYAVFNNNADVVRILLKYGAERKVDVYNNTTDEIRELLDSNEFNKILK